MLLPPNPNCRNGEISLDGVYKTGSRESTALRINYAISFGFRKPKIHNFHHSKHCLIQSKKDNCTNRWENDPPSINNLHEKLLNINLLIAKIESLNDNPNPARVLKSPSLFPILVEDSDYFLEKTDTSLSYSNNSLIEFETFSNHTEETNSGSITTHADYSLPKYDSFLFEIKPDQGELTGVVMEDNLAEPRVLVPNVLATHPTLMLDSDFIPSDNSLQESEIFYFDIKEKNTGITTINVDISLLNLECFNFKSEPDPGELTSIVDFGIHENVLSATNVNLPPKEDNSTLFAYVV
nr:hypothetical protein [Tanacetum cinerariifolium]